MEKPKYYRIIYHSNPLEHLANGDIRSRIEYEKVLNLIPVFLRRDTDGSWFYTRLLPKEEKIGNEINPEKIKNLDQLLQEIGVNIPHKDCEISIVEIGPVEYALGIYPDLTIEEKEEVMSGYEYWWYREIENLR